MKFAKFLRTPIFKEHLWWLLHFFEDNGLKKQNKAEILQKLEKEMEKDDYRI